MPHTCQRAKHPHVKACISTPVQHGLEDLQRVVQVGAGVCGGDAHAHARRQQRRGGEAHHHDCLRQMCKGGVQNASGIAAEEVKVAAALAGRARHAQQCEQDAGRVIRCIQSSLQACAEAVQLTRPRSSVYRETPGSLAGLNSMTGCMAQGRGIPGQGAGDGCSALDASAEAWVSRVSQAGLMPTWAPAQAPRAPIASSPSTPKMCYAHRPACNARTITGESQSPSTSKPSSSRPRRK